MNYNPADYIEVDVCSNLSVAEATGFHNQVSSRKVDAPELREDNELAGEMNDEMRRMWEEREEEAERHNKVDFIPIIGGWTLKSDENYLDVKKRKGIFYAEGKLGGKTFYGCLGTEDDLMKRTTRINLIRLLGV